MRTLTLLTLGAVSLIHAHGLDSQPNKQVKPEFDIVKTEIRLEGRTALFRMEVSGKAGASKPASNGKLAGSRVFSYVWPTSLDPAEAGFEGKAGILAFVVASHSDFDDTPLFDEDGNGKPDDDGGVWHSHWVVLVPDSACGPKALKVKDIPAGAHPRLPKTWPGLPLYLDSPGYSPVISGRSVEVRVPMESELAAASAGYDGVTAALRVNASIHAPLLCVENVIRIARSSSNRRMSSSSPPTGTSVSRAA